MVTECRFLVSIQIHFLRNVQQVNLSVRTLSNLEGE